MVYGVDECIGSKHWIILQERKELDRQLSDLVHLSYYNKTPQTMRSINCSNLFFRFLEADTRLRCQQMWCLLKAHFLIHRCFPFAESYHGRRDLERIRRTSLRKSVILTLKSRSQDLLTFSTGSPPGTLTLQVNICYGLKFRP